MALKPSWSKGNISKTGTQNGSVYYVDYSVTSSGDGKTFETAFKTIAEALSAVTTGKGDTIYIAIRNSEEVFIEEVAKKKPSKKKPSKKK